MYLYIHTPYFELLLTKAQRQCDKAKPLGNAKNAQKAEQKLRATVTASPLHTGSWNRPIYVGIFPRS